MKLTRIMRILVLSIFLTFASSVIVNAQSPNYDQALKLYLQVINGQKKMQELSPEQQHQVIIIHRIISKTSDGNTSSECQDARDRARSAADDLATYARRLKSCAENHDYSDDCSSEYRRTKNAYRDYETAVSEVSSHCN